MLRIGLSALAVAMSATVALANSGVPEELSYEPSVARLSGTLVVEDHYGPPNFGETPDVDKVEKTLILRLDKHVVVRARTGDSVNGDTFDDVSSVQLISTGMKLTDQIGRHVTLEGTLFEKQNGEHFTDVLLSVRKFVPEE